MPPEQTPKLPPRDSDLTSRIVQLEQQLAELSARVAQIEREREEEGWAAMGDDL